MPTTRLSIPCKASYRNNHHKPTFHPLGNFLNPALALLGQGLKKSPIEQKLDFVQPFYLGNKTLYFEIGTMDKA
jgi:hypothetical protein